MLIFGRTEIGHVGDSLYREPGDDTWDYVRPYASLRPHMVFKPRGSGDVYEAVYLKTHPALKMSNSDDPAGSFHSRDLWTPHSTLPDAWKYIARDDDTVTLLSGEKILPLGIEGAIRECPLVRDALVVGNDRLSPGVLLFRAAAAEGEELSDDEFVDAVWPHVQAGNQIADEFARVTRDMVVPLPADVDYPATDKNNIIRGAAYAQFADYIDAVYSEKPQTQINGGETSKPLKKASNVDELQQQIMDLVRNQADVDMADAQTDFFAAGVDSLRAAQIRRLLLKNVDLGDHSLPTNAIYDAGNVETLAQRLYSMSLGNAPTNGQTIKENATNGDSESDLDLMQKLVDEYGSFQRWKPGDLPNPEKETVVSICLSATRSSVRYSHQDRLTEIHRSSPAPPVPSAPTFSTSSSRTPRSTRSTASSAAAATTRPRMPSTASSPPCTSATCPRRPRSPSSCTRSSPPSPPRT